MPQRQVYRDNPAALMAPIAAGVSKLSSDIGTGIQNVSTQFQAQNIQNTADAANLKTFNEIKDFFGPVPGIDLAGLEPMKNEPTQNYQARIKQAAPKLVEQLRSSGVDPVELQNAMQIPGFALDDVKSLIYKRTGAQLKERIAHQAVPADTLADIKAGQLSIDEINQKHNTSLTQEEYNRIAGLQEAPTPAAAPIAAPAPEPAQAPAPAPIMAPGTSQFTSSRQTVRGSAQTPVTVGPGPAPAQAIPAAAPTPAPGEIPAPIMAAHKAEEAKRWAAKTQPLTTQEASMVGGIKQPMSYLDAVRLVEQADLPPDQKKEFEPILARIADQEAARIAGKTGIPQKEYLAEGGTRGLPVTERQKLTAGGLVTERAMLSNEQKASYSRMREHEQDNTKLRILMDWAKFSAGMARNYGKDKTGIIKELGKKLNEYQDLQNNLSIALGTTSATTGEDVQDAPVIMQKMIQVDQEIQRLRGELPGIDRMVEQFTRPSPASVQEPVFVPEGGNPPAIPAPAPKEKPPLSSKRYNK
jgi:hypothetical protein